MGVLTVGSGYLRCNGVEVKSVVGSFSFPTVWTRHQERVLLDCIVFLHPVVESSKVFDITFLFAGRSRLVARCISCFSDLNNLCGHLIELICLAIAVECRA